MHGVLIHHTATPAPRVPSGSARRPPDLPGPLCHGVITKDGTVHLVGGGRANHAGLGDGDVLRAVIAEKRLPPDNEADTDGNRAFYGFECENLGDGKDPWPEAQLAAMEKAAAALCRAHGWSDRSVIGHLEWQPGKVDPRGFAMDDLRERIGAAEVSRGRRPGRAAPPARRPRQWTRDPPPPADPALCAPGCPPPSRRSRTSRSRAAAYGCCSSGTI